jgi:hypothetical protein
MALAMPMPMPSNATRPAWSLLGKHDVDRVFKRLQRIRGAAIGPHSESTVALLFAEVCHKAKALRDPDV